MKMHSQTLPRYALTLLNILPIFQKCIAHPTARSVTPNDQNQLDFGLQIAAGGCTGAHLTAMETAITDTNYLAAAAINSAVNFTSPPFNYFFESNNETSNIVTGALHRVQSALHKKGALINATCTDTHRQCQVSVERLILGYTSHTTPSEIVLCNIGLSLPRNPKPCTENPGTVSLGFILLHEMMHIRYISGVGLKIDDLTRRTARDVNDKLRAGVNTTLDANAYAHMGSMAWDMGLGCKPSKGRVTCLQSFERGNFDGSVEDDAAIREMVGIDGLRL